MWPSFQPIRVPNSLSTLILDETSWWFVMVYLWWFCGGSWWFVIFYSLEKGHVTLFSTNQRPKFTMKSHFWWDFVFAPFHLKSIPLKSSAKKLEKTTQLIYDEIMARLRQELPPQRAPSPQARLAIPEDLPSENEQPVNNPPLPTGNLQYITLSQHLPNSLITQNAQDQFVDLLRLAPNNPNEVDKPMQLYTTADGTPAFRPVKDRNTVTNLFQYLWLMFIYGVPYLTNNPQRGPEFLQYLHSIVKVDLRYTWSAVLQYDLEFRRFRQNNPDHCWADPVFHLRSNLQASHNLKANNPTRAGNRSNQTTAGAGEQSQRPVCKNFNKGTF